MTHTKNNSAIQVDVSDNNDTAGMFNTYQHIFNAFNTALIACSSVEDQLPPIGFHTRMDKIIKDYLLDELDLVELEMEFEDTLEVEIPDGTIEQSITVFDLVNTISKITGRLFDTDPNPTPTATPVDTSHDNDLGILVLPSLQDHGRQLVIQGVSIEEAKVLTSEFNNRVLKLRKCKNALYPSTINGDLDHIEFYHNVIRFDQLNYDTDFEAMDAQLEELSKSNVPKTRGLRALFISPTVIGVGTTVIYNRNWATINFSDDTVFGQLQEIAEEHS